VVTSWNELISTSCLVGVIYAIFCNFISYVFCVSLVSFVYIVQILCFAGIFCLYRFCVSLVSFVYTDFVCEFSLLTVDQRKSFKPAPFQISYFKMIKYQGTVVIRIQVSNTISTTKSKINAFTITVGNVIEIYSS
jgi:hypothetical protein